jgi:integrase
VPKSGQKAGYNFGLPLNRDALLILRKLKTLNPTGAHVFQYTPPGKEEAQPIDDFNTAAFQKACVRAELDERTNWHSLRHTWATWAVQEGVTLHA